MMKKGEKDRTLLILAAICILLGLIVLILVYCGGYQDLRFAPGTMIVENIRDLDAIAFRKKLQRVIRNDALDPAEIRYVWFKDGKYLVQIQPTGTQDKVWDLKASVGWRIQEAWIILVN